MKATVISNLVRLHYVKTYHFEKKKFYYVIHNIILINADKKLTLTRQANKISYISSSSLSLVSQSSVTHLTREYLKKSYKNNFLLHQLLESKEASLLIFLNFLFSFLLVLFVLNIINLCCIVFYTYLNCITVLKIILCN